MKERMLITGVSGLLGNNLAYYFRIQYDILGLYFTFPIRIKGIKTKKCDLTRLDKISELVSDFDPAIIIHCASETNC